MVRKLGFEKVNFTDWIVGVLQHEPVRVRAVLLALIIIVGWAGFDIAVPVEGLLGFLVILGVLTEDQRKKVSPTEESVSH